MNGRFVALQASVKKSFHIEVVRRPSKVILLRSSALAAAMGEPARKRKCLKYMVGVGGWTRGFAAQSFGPHFVRLSALRASVRPVLTACQGKSGRGVSIGWARVSRRQSRAYNLLLLIGVLATLVRRSSKQVTMCQE